MTSNRMSSYVPATLAGALALSCAGCAGDPSTSDRDTSGNAHQSDASPAQTSPRDGGAVVRDASPPAAGRADAPPASSTSSMPAGAAATKGDGGDAKADAGSSAAGSTNVDAAAADGGSQAGDDERYAAVNAIKQAFLDNAYDRYTSLAPQIDAAANTYPQDPTIARYAAVLRLWRLTEAAREPSLTLLDQAPVLLEAQAAFDTAKQLAPNDGRLQGWSAALTIRSAQLIGSEPQIEQGKQELEAAVPSYPGFNLFVQGAALGALPRSDPDFARAADKMFAALETCGIMLDQEQPVFTPPASASDMTTGVCATQTFVPHSLEGLFLNLGDVLTKAGKKDAAKIAYQNAQRAPAYATWPYQARLEQRIEDIEQNAGSDSFQTAIEDGVFCVGCHATKL